MIETQSRSCEGWFRNRQLSNCCFGTTPRGIRFAIPLPSLLRRAVRFFSITDDLNLQTFASSTEHAAPVRQKS